MPDPNTDPPRQPQGDDVTDRSSTDRSARGQGGRRAPAGRRGPAGFDRIKTAEQRERTDGPGTDAGRPSAERGDGRAALFGAGDAAGTAEPAAAAAPAGSAGPAEAAAHPGAPRALTVAVVHCSACDATSPLDVLTALRGVVPFVVVPWSDHPWWAPCPACGLRTWLRPEVVGA